MSGPDLTSADGHLALDPHVAREVAGHLGAHLKWLGETLGVQIRQRGGEFRVEGEPAAQQLALRLLVQLAGLAEAGRALHPSDVSDGLRLLQQDAEGDLGTFFRDVILTDVRKRPLTARTANQRAYVSAMRRSELVFGVGPAGSGKTYLAMALGVSFWKKGAVRRLVLTRPAVEAGEKLGFLPGDLTEKVDPYLRPLYDALAEMVDPQELTGMMQKGVIEVAPLAFMRGRTLSDAFVVLDEAQNTTVEQMKMFLTRLGQNSRMVVTGDPSQVDLPRGRPSGLAHALLVLDGVAGLDIVRLTGADIVRHPLVARVVDAYERDARESGEGGG